MATNVHEFTVGIEQAVELFDVERKTLTRALVLRALRDIVMNTRVKTGRARGNWQVSESDPIDVSVLRNDKDGSRVLAIEGQKVLALSGNEIVWIANNLAYIGFLEDLDKMVFGAEEALKTYIRSAR